MNVENVIKDFLISQKHNICYLSSNSLVDKRVSDVATVGNARRKITKILSDYSNTGAQLYGWNIEIHSNRRRKPVFVARR